MNSSIIGFIALLLYIIGFVYQINRFNKRISRSDFKATLIYFLAVIFHGYSAFSMINVAEGWYLGVSYIASLISWLVVCLVVFSNLKRPLDNLFMVLFPIAFIALGAALAVKTPYEPKTYTPQLFSHIVLSIFAYSLLSIATVQALILAYQNRQLKHHPPSLIIKAFPPLQTMEHLLFEMIWIGWILLSLAILTGTVYKEDLSGQHLIHKTVLSSFAWVIFGILLWGKHRRGWRGNKAFRFVIGGFISLLLAYFGSKIVLELILFRI